MLLAWLDYIYIYYGFAYGNQTWPIKWNAVSSRQRSYRYCCMDALLGRKLNGWRRSKTAITQECCEQYWTSPGGNTPQGVNYTATCLQSRKVRRTRHAGHCWRSRDELISDVLLRTPTYGRAKAGRPARTYIQHLCEDTGCNPDDLQETMNDREKWRERVRDIRASGTTWWWWWYIMEVLLMQYIYVCVRVCVCVCVCVWLNC